MKKSLMFALFLGCISFAYSSNKMAIDYYGAGDYAKAKSLFKAGNMDAMDNYYLGQIYLSENKNDSAKYCFEKGLQLDPENGYNKVGLATLSKDDKVLKDISKEKSYKKNAQMMIAIAQAYQTIGDASKSDSYVSKAKKVDKKSSLPYLFEGDQLLAQKKTSDAASKYDNAIYFDANDKLAYLKSAKVYENVRAQVAIDYLKKALEIDPNYAPGLKTLANIYYSKGFYPEALETYEKYLSVVTPIPSDYEDYAKILYFNKKYNDALTAINKAPNTFVMNRLRMYSLNSLNQYDDALATADKFFKMKAKTDSIISLDYTTYADLLSGKKDYVNAAKNYEKAYIMDTTQVDLLKDVAKTYSDAKDYDKAISYYDKLTTAPGASLADIFTLGQTEYFAGNDTTLTSANRKKYLVMADSTFSKISNELPDNYLGSFWRARTNSALDPETTLGLAKPYYDKAVGIMKTDPQQYKSQLLEAYRYGVVYSVKANDTKGAIKYLNDMLVVDPENTWAGAVLKQLTK